MTRLERRPSSKFRIVRTIELAGGKTWTVVRRVRPNGSVETRYRDSRGRPHPAADFRAARARALQTVFRARGAMTEELALRSEQLKDGEVLPVVGFLAVTEEHNNLTGRKDDAVLSEIRALQKQVHALLGQSGQSRFEPVGGTPLAKLVLDETSLKILAFSKLFYRLDIAPGPWEPISTAWWHATRTDRAFRRGWTGRGQTVAIMECQPDDYTFLPNVSAIRDPAEACGPRFNAHGRMVAGVVTNSLIPERSAANANLVIANARGMPDGETELWALENGASIINHSIAVESCGPRGLSIYSLYRDWLTVFASRDLGSNLTRPTFVLGAGNNCTDSSDLDEQFVRNRLYNGVIVGGSDDKGDPRLTNDTIMGASSWRNPFTPASDRELPEVVAPAANIDVLDLGGATRTETGTSLSGPMVAGILATMLERNEELRRWPQARKAVVLASAQCSVDGGELSLVDGIDDRDGVGLVNADLATDVLSDPLSERNDGAAIPWFVPDQVGFMSGVLFYSSFRPGLVWEKRPLVQTLASGWLSVVLTWSATPLCETGDPSTCVGFGPDADLNLALRKVGSSEIAGASFSFDNNYEAIIARLEPNTVYEIFVSASDLRTLSGTEFGLAWISSNFKDLAGCSGGVPQPPIPPPNDNPPPPGFDPPGFGEPN